MSHRACGADGACVTGELLVASCRESSHIAEPVPREVWFGRAYLFIFWPYWLLST